MPLSKFVAASADRQEAIETVAKEKQPAIKTRFNHLVNNPHNIVPDILDDFITDGFEVMLAETGNEALATAFWEQVAFMLQSPLDVLAETPVEQRGDVWNAATSVLVSVAQIQAEIESGLIQEAAVIGVESGAELKTLTKGIPNERLKKATFNIKPELAKRKKERKQNGSKE